VNFRLASSIYGKPWLIDSQTALAYLQILENGGLEKIRGGFLDDDEEEPKTIFQKLFTGSNGITVAPIHRADAVDHPGYEGNTIGILPVIGPMMKEDSCGWYGTANLKNELNKMSATSSIKAIVALIDTPGGTVDGNQAFADAYKASPKEKITVIDGMMCSAGYWFGSGGDEVIATSQTDIIGCIGTMIAFYDYSKRYQEMGIVLREFRATASKDKNKDYNEAKKGNGSLLIESTLDPMNDVFLNAVRTNRGDKLDQKKTLSGKTYVGQQAVDVGLVDRIESMDQVLTNLIQKHNKISTLKIAI
jgi:signal peptide peptidase SppA